MVPVTVESNSLFSTILLLSVLRSPTGEVLLPPVLLASIVTLAVPTIVNSIPPDNAFPNSNDFTLPVLLSVLCVIVPTVLKNPSA